MDTLTAFENKQDEYTRRMDRKIVLNYDLFCKKVQNLMKVHQETEILAEKLSNLKHK